MAAMVDPAGAVVHSEGVVAYSAGTAVHSAVVAAQVTAQRAAAGEGPASAGPFGADNSVVLWDDHAHAALIVRSKVLDSRVAALVDNRG